MDEIYIIEGWFGSDEWIESVWLVKAEAEEESARLWETRRSELLAPDDYKQGICKFQVVPYPIRRKMVSEVPSVF